MNNALLYFGGLLVVVLSALFAVPNLVDWNGYRGIFEEEASKVLGRDVRVGGSVNLKLFPVPYMRFEKIRISNASGQSGDAFVRADSFTMWLSAPALLRGVVEASQIELNKPMITLTVDGSGGGNWNSIELKPGDLPFVPRDVALRSVRVKDGSVAVYNATGDRVGAIDHIDGELSADGLKGPFRYKGAATWSGNVHDVKLATETADMDGNFGLKLSAKAEQSPTAYTLDGQVSALTSKPTFKGSWTAKLAVPGIELKTADNKTTAPLVDVKSTVTADTLGAKFDDVVLSIDTAGGAQMVSGSAAAAWTSPPHLDVALSSKWLDIDWLAGAGKNAASFGDVKRLALGLLQSVAGDGAATAKINLEQVKVGGENAGGLALDAQRQGTTTHFKTFKISLPGSSRLDLAGDFKSDGGKMSFSGDVFVAGNSLERLKSWAGKSGVAVDIKTDAAFSAGGKLEMDDTRFALADASGEIGGKSFAGDIAVTHDGHERTEVTLQAPEIDTREIFPAATAELDRTLRKALGLAPPESGDDSKSATLPGDLRLRVIAGQWTTGDSSYRDVDFTFEREGDEIRLPAAKLSTAHGLAVGLEGRVKVNSGHARGTLAYDLVGKSPDAVQDIVRLTALRHVLSQAQMAGLKEGKIAGLLKLGGRGDDAADVSFDGTINGFKLAGSAEFDGGLNAWRSKPSRLDATLDAPSLAPLLAVLGAPSVDATRGANAAAQLAFASTGTLSDGVVSRIDVKADDQLLAYSGKFAIPENDVATLNGSLDVQSKDLAGALALVGFPLASGAVTVGANGTVALVRDADGLKVSSQNLVVGGSIVASNLRIKTTPGGPQHIDGEIAADRLSVTALLSALTNGTSHAVAAAAPVAVVGTTRPAAPGGVPAEPGPAADAVTAQALWPEGGFNLAAFKNTDALIALRFRSLALSGTLATHEGTAKLELGPGRVRVTDLEANAAGGKLSGFAKFDQSPDGVQFGGKLSLANAQLSSTSSAGKGTLAFDFDVNGRAQSPAGLMSVVAGSGRLRTDNGKIPGPDAAAVSAVVNNVLAGKAQNDARSVNAALLATLDSSSFDIGSREVGIKIADGTVKFDSVAQDTENGKVEASGSLELGSLALTAAAQMTANVAALPPPPIALPGYQPPAEKPPPPPAIVLYSGRLDDPSKIAASVDATALQRELTVRQTERNVEQLTLARRVDEERFRLEKEKRRKAEEDRLAAVAAARAKWQAEHAPAAVSPAPPAVTPAPQGATTEQPESPPDPATAPATEAAPKPADPAGSTLSTQKVTVEPDLPPTTDAAAPATAAPATPAIDPATGLPVPPKTDATKTYAPRPSRSEQSRSSSDEVMKSLGGGFQ